MSTTYITLTNKVLQQLNEVALTSLNFNTATGFHAAVKEWINTAIYDIYSEEDYRWPFQEGTVNINLEVGERRYDLFSQSTSSQDNRTSIDWNSFYLDNSPIPVGFEILTPGTANVYTNGHGLITGDTITITGSPVADYNGTHVVTVVTYLEFTFPVTGSPANDFSDTARYRPNYSTTKLTSIDNQTYLNNYLANDLNATSYNRPQMVVRDQQSDLIVSPIPDKPYVVTYTSFTTPATLITENSTIAIPDPFAQIIVDKALHYAYMFRDNMEQAQLAEQRYQNGILKMRRILIPQPNTMRFDY